MKYMLIHCVDESVVDHETIDADTASALAAWIEEMTRRAVLHDGGRLRNTSDATTVRIRQEELLITDGPFAETKEQVAGYDVIECGDLDEAIEVASRHPTAKLGTIEVRPILAS